jgi:hypothetical protein
VSARLHRRTGASTVLLAAVNDAAPRPRPGHTDGLIKNLLASWKGPARCPLYGVISFEPPGGRCRTTAGGAISKKSAFVSIRLL